MHQTQTAHLALPTPALPGSPRLSSGPGCDLALCAGHDPERLVKADTQATIRLLLDDTGLIPATTTTGRVRVMERAPRSMPVALPRETRQMERLDRSSILLPHPPPHDQGHRLSVPAAVAMRAHVLPMARL